MKNNSTGLAQVVKNHVLIGVFLANSFWLSSSGFTVDGFQHTGKRWQNKKANFLGDSITAGGTYGDSTVNVDGSGPYLVDKPYHSYFQTYCGFTTIRNYGIGGTRVQVSDTRTDSFLERFPNMDNDADVIGVLGGVNDWWGNRPLGNFNDRINTTFYGALHLLYSGLIDKYPDKTIFTMTPLKMFRTGVPELNSRGDTLEQFAEAVRKVSDYYSIPCLDLSKISGLSRNISQQTLLMPDGVHPNNAGQKRIAVKIASFINKL